MTGALTHMDEQRPDGGTPGASWLRGVKAVAWAFLGVRKRSEYQQDLGKINPLHVIAIGIAGAVLFVAALAALVHWVVR